MINKKVPQRRCVGCGESKGKKELIRILRTPEQEVMIDAGGRKNGRGAYICPNPECLKKARKSKGLERSLDIKIPDSVYDMLEQQLIKEMTRSAE